MGSGLEHRAREARFWALNGSGSLTSVSAALSVRAIAKALGQAPSTISRELARNASAGGSYRPYSAEKQRRPATFGTQARAGE